MGWSHQDGKSVDLQPPGKIMWTQLTSWLHCPRPVQSLRQQYVLLCALAIAFQLCSVSYATQYKVGESNGWNAGLRANEVNAWVANITFRVNDTLYFLYDQSVHNVLVVNQDQYLRCDNSTPIQVYFNGSTVVLLDRVGWWYFIDGIGNWCAQGVKIAMEVHNNAKKSTSTAVIVGVSIAVAVVVLGFIGGLVFYCLRRTGSQEDIEGKALNTEVHRSWKDFEAAGSESGELSNVPSGGAFGQREVLDTMHVRPYTQAEVKDFTADFSNQIGRGGYGPVFSGKLKNGQAVAVKVSSSDSQQGEREFINEVKLLSLIHHKNIVPLVGYCQEGNQQILLYEYMDGGDLRARLDDSANPLNWRERLSVALDAAKGLEYLHTGASSLPIIHRDIKASNILLSRKMVAKVADFGLSKLAPSEDITHISTQIKGTAGYLDPEYYVTRQLTEGSDVYSFGVLLFELISARRPIFQVVPGTNIGIVEWVKQSLRSATVENIVDPLLQGEFESDSVWKVAEIGLQCVDMQRQSRPSMSAVVRELKQAFNIELGNVTSDRSNAIDSFINRAAANGPPVFSSPLHMPILKSTSSQESSEQIEDTQQPIPR
eukprot:TRINITY_DN6800_c0_g2_i1.p1 TRINITY_DN6800_c0_g2~~TRINITY_DN6800_c0_g2_i1.p1  ORF type:complete len:599 (-),score=78.09 TRINITY_DN6800_c0_g2_i1:729-2525(-)